MTFSANAFKDRTILVTGASSGIGRSAAIALSALGAQLILVGRNSERLAETLQGLSGAGHRSEAAEMNDLEGVSALVSRLAADVGGLDGVFHSAGLEVVNQVRLLKQKHLDDVFSAALFGGLGIAKSAGKAGVLKEGASLVFMSSVAAHRGRPGMVAYSAAKASVEGLVRSLACEFAPKGYRVNCIAAGGVETAMHDRLTRALPEAAVDAYRAAHPLGFGRPEDVADAAVFLLSDASRWITGTTMTVDGGYTAA